jgi:hypothetical protein
MKEAPRKTGKWLRDDIPHTGWRCIEIDERGGICEMCEVTQIVYAHRMAHDRCPLWPDCGCVCAGFMAEEPATEQLRELLYKWRKLQWDTPIEKLRRKGWHRGSRKQGHVFGWSFSDRVHHSPIDSFGVEISNADGWRFHVYHPWHTEIRRSEPFATDVLAATVGIAWAEMLMAASECEAIAERRAASDAETLARDIRFTALQARELGREDIAATAPYQSCAAIRRTTMTWNRFAAEVLFPNPADVPAAAAALAAVDCEYETDYDAIDDYSNSVFGMVTGTTELDVDELGRLLTDVVGPFGGDVLEWGCGRLNDELNAGSVSCLKSRGQKTS